MYSIYLFEVNKNISKNIKYIFFILGLTFIFIIILWPYLWFDPINNFIKAFTDIIAAHNNLSVITLFNGEYITSTNTPWFYRILWFYITIPVIVGIFFTIGFSIIIVNFVKRILELNDKNQIIWKNNEDFYDFYLFFVVIAVCFLTIKFNDSQFNGWRHLYFLYSVIIYFSIFAYKLILKNKKNFLKYFLNSIIIINISYNLIWIFKNHPHQNNYFNFISLNYALEKFDLDYWGLSNYHSLKFILKNDKRNKINISTISFADLNVSILKLNSNEKKRINIIYNPEEADYLINSYMPKLRKNFKISQDKFIRLHDIKVNKTSINTIYKKKLIKIILYNITFKMKLFIYKSLIIIFFLNILFELTIGSRLDQLRDQITFINDQKKRIEIKEKILDEMEKGTEKENYFNDKEREVISNFINKILNELKINSN